jgi:iron complex outermembrane receptor protein
VNIIQKKRGSGEQISLNGGQYYDVRGRSGEASLNIGISPCDKAFLNLTFDSNFHDFTFSGDVDPRIVPQTSQAAAYSLSSRPWPARPTIHTRTG